MEQFSSFPDAPSSWNVFPLMARSIIIGFLVSSVGVAAWAIFLVSLPAPWSILPMVPALWLYLRYFGGVSGSHKTRTWRRFCFRLLPLHRSNRLKGIATALLFVIIVQASFVITFRLFPFPSGRFTAGYKILDTMPGRVAWMIVIMSSVVAGICEETGFRGYLQAPLEKRYGPLTAITVTSFVFVMIHLNKQWALPILPNIFFASILLGMMAHRFQTLVYGIIAHSILDVFDYSFWWSDMMGGFHRATIFRTGVDFHFVASITIFFISICIFFWCLHSVKTKS